MSQAQRRAELIVIGTGNTVICAEKCLLKTRLDIWVKKGRRVRFYELIFSSPDPRKARCHIKSNNKTVGLVSRPIWWLMIRVVWETGGLAGNDAVTQTDSVLLISTMSYRFQSFFHTTSDCPLENEIRYKILNWPSRK